MSYRRPATIVMLIATLTILLPQATVASGNALGAVQTFHAQLRGDTEMPPGDPNGFGFARISVDPTSGEVCFRLSVAGISPAIAAHIHDGDAGETGPVVVPLSAPVNDGMSSGCVTVALTVAASIVVGASSFYVNVHTDDLPAGALRGQLSRTDGGADGTRPPLTVVASGLDNPRGMTVAPDGTLYVTEAGHGGDECVEVEPGFSICFGPTGGITRVQNGEQERWVSGITSWAAGPEINSISDIEIAENGDAYATIGCACPPEVRAMFGPAWTDFATLVRVSEEGSWEQIVDIGAHEVADPDGRGAVTNPFKLELVDDGFVIADAAANTLLHVANGGSITTLAVFPTQPAPAPAFLGEPPGTMIDAESVPTALAVGPDGAYYVGELTGFPFQPGTSRIWRVVAGEEPAVFASGFSHIIDMTFDDEGQLLILELLEESLLTTFNPFTGEDHPLLAHSVLVSLNPDGTRTTIVGPDEGLVFATGLTIGNDGEIYIANYGKMPGMGEVVRVNR